MSNCERTLKEILDNDELLSEKKEDLYNYLLNFRESLIPEQVRELKEGIKKHTEILNTASKEYHDYLLSQGFEFTTEDNCYYWETYLAVHKDYIEQVKEYGREYYDLEEGQKPIPDWAIIEVTKEVYNN